MSLGETISFWGLSGLMLLIASFLGTIAGLAAYYALIRHLLQTPHLRDKEAERELKATIVELKARLQDAGDSLDAMRRRCDELERHVAHDRQMAGVIAGAK